MLLTKYCTWKDLYEEDFEFRYLNWPRVIHLCSHDARTGEFVIAFALEFLTWRTAKGKVEASNRFAPELPRHDGVIDELAILLHFLRSSLL